jgi:hypothetical protein
MITKSYIEGLKQRVELVREAQVDVSRFEFAVRNLLDYLEGLDYFVEEEKNMICIPRDALNDTAFKNGYIGKLGDVVMGMPPKKKKMRCEICKNPLYERQDGSLVCVEMHH